MPLVTTKELLLNAKQNHYAVGAFNIENMEMAQAVISAAEELNAPVILQTTPSTVKYGGLDLYFSIVAAAAENSRVPVALHLDHGDSFELAAQALKAGYTSIMIDGSHKPFEENIALTKRVADMCAPNNIPVEAELGKVGGKEDDLEAKADLLTDPQEAKAFIGRTNISSLAVAIGTAHGIYASTPKLDIARLGRINDIADIPLVLHGASGLSDKDVRDCIKQGICKVNFATELRIAFTDGVKRVLAENPAVFDPKILGKAGKENIKKLVEEKIMVCGCENKYCKAGK